MKKIWMIILCVFLFSCKTAPETKNFIQLKYPVILVHGIIAHDRKVMFSFWGRIPQVLEENGVQVFFGNTDAWGNYESNAEILKNTVDAVLSETNSEKVNIISHSKGGLDSRYFLWKYDYGDKVASLTTISTPHRGAELADVIWEQPVIHSDVSKDTLDLFGHLYGDVHPDMYNIVYDLSTVNMKDFNNEVILDPNVFFQSMYTTMNKADNDPILTASYRYIRDVRGANDGVVSEYSASWGDNVIRIDGGISHHDIIDLRMKNISGLDIPKIYLQIVRDLAARGF